MWPINPHPKSEYYVAGDLLHRCLHFQLHENTYIQSQIQLTQRSKLVRILKGEKEIKSVWTIDGRINCTFDRDGHEVRKVIESPDDLFKLGWTEAKIAGLGLYADV